MYNSQMQNVNLSFFSFFWLVIPLVIIPFFEGGRAIHAFAFTLLCILPLTYFLLKSDQFVVFKNKYIVSFAIFLVLASVSAALTSHFYASFFALMWWWIYFVMFVSALTLLDEKKSKVVSHILIAVAFVLGAVGVYFFLLDTGGYIRLRSLFYQHNAFGGFMLLPAFLSLGYFFQTQIRNWKITWGIISSILLSVLILTFSRGSMLSFLLAGFLVICFSICKNNFKLWTKMIAQFLAVLFVGVLIAAAIFSLNAVKSDSTVSDRSALLYSGATADENAFSLRVRYFDEALGVIKENPFFGTGLDNYIDTYNRLRQDVAYYSVDPHNVYLRLAAETGIASLALYVFFALLLVCMYKMVRNSDLTKNESVFTLAVVAGLLSMLIHNGMDIDWRYPANVLIFFIFSAILIRLSQKETIFITTFNSTVFYKIIFGISALLIIPGMLAYISRDHLEEGMYYVSKDKIPEAIYELNKAQQFNYLKNANVPYQLSSAYLLKYYVEKNDEERKNAFILAEKYMNEALRYWPTNSVYYRSQSQLDQINGKTTAQEQALKRSIYYDKTASFYSYMELGKLYVKQERYEEVISLLEDDVNMFAEYTKTVAFDGYIEKSDLLFAISSMYSSLGTAYEMTGQKEKASEVNLNADHYMKEGMKAMFEV